MRWISTTAAAVIYLAGAAGVVCAQPVAPTPTAPSIDELMGKKLTAIDGSSIALNPAEGGMAREIVSVNGSVQSSYFAYLSETLGTVADATDLRKITGVFRRNGAALEIEYADGSSEKLRLNSGGGVTLESITPAATSCVSWYPEGHVFSLNERKAALAAFAARLGLGDSGVTAAASTDCTIAPSTPEDKLPAVKAEMVAPQPTIGLAKPKAKPGKAGAGAPPYPPVPAASPKTVLAAANPVPPATAPTAASVAAETRQIEVRKSEVHLIDPVPVDAGQPQVLASATPPPLIAPDQHGASTCLSVESDGMHWGFRNHCGYVVQFAYCLMSGAQLVSCNDGAVAGSVTANGFGALVADESLKETDARHEFRWVACQGGAGEVIPHLDQVDPPSGRCVR
jgi:hypothetical protein